MQDINYLKHDRITSHEIEMAQHIAISFYKGEYGKELLKQGNKKLPKNCAIWSLPSRVTCKYACKDCYAYDAERQYKNTRVYRASRYEIIKMALADNNKRKYFIRAIIAELKYKKSLYKNFVVRIHDSGDFYNQEYLELWLEIINKCKSIKFYTYTKTLNQSEIDRINGEYKNLNIVNSLINGKINYDTKDKIFETYHDMIESGQKCFICPCHNQEGVCICKCRHCLTEQNILFVKH